MTYQAQLFFHPLEFSFKAGTSRGFLSEKPSWFLKLTDGEKTGWGEVSLIPNLHPETPGDINSLFQQHLKSWKEKGPEVLNDIPENVPAFRFGWEQAIADLKSAEGFKIYDNGFSGGERAIPINGLIWMGTQQEMLDQVHKKVGEGFFCIKMKIGALDFEEEIELLRAIREHYPAETTELRVDANGAFPPDEAHNKLERLAEFNLHSIEQPVIPDHKEALRSLAETSSAPLALDESLIGLHAYQDKKVLLQNLRPPFIVLKPSLTGGLYGTKEWINLAEEMGIGWWITSALESNIGLNAIAQFTAEYDIRMPQGLGTGRLFTNNITAPLSISNGNLHYNPKESWDLSGLSGKEMN